MVFLLNFRDIKEVKTFIDCLNSTLNKAQNSKNDSEVDEFDDFDENEENENEESEEEDSNTENINPDEDENDGTIKAVTQKPMPVAKKNENDAMNYANMTIGTLNTTKRRQETIKAMEK